MSDPTEEQLFAEAISGEEPDFSEHVAPEPAPAKEPTAGDEPAPEPAADPEPEPVAAGEETQGEPVAEPASAEGINIPKHRFDEVNEKRKEAEERAREWEKQNNVLAGQIQQIQQQLSQQPQTPQPQPEQGDLNDEFFADPVGFMNKQLAAKDAALQEQITRAKVETSLEMARQQAPDDFQAALDYVDSVRDPALNQRIMSSGVNAGKTLLDTYRQHKLMSETGGDLNAFRQKLRDEMLNDPETLKQLGEKLRASQTTAAPGGTPNIVIPPSVNSGTSSAPSSATERLPESEEDFFRDAVSG